jgi:hypothetical protein
MTDLQARIKNHVDQTVPAVDVDRLVAQLVAQGEPQPRPTTALSAPGRRKWIAVAVGAAAVILLVGGVALLSEPTETPVITQATTPTSIDDAPDPTLPGVVPPPPTLPTQPESSVWTRHDVIGNDLGASAVVSASPGFVAGGTSYTQGDVWGRGTIWTSNDGTYWKRVPNPLGELFQEGHFVTGVASSASGTLVFGPNNRQGGTVVWHSADGEEWIRISTGEAPLDGEPVTDGIGLSSGGFVLYGAEMRCSLPSPRCEPADLPRLLVSPDGITWEQVTTPVTFTAIVEIVPGELLAAADGGDGPLTWRSQDDGRTWSSSSPAWSDGGGTELWTMEVTPVGLLVAGIDRDNRPTIWMSEDGVQFTPTLQLPQRVPDWEESNFEIVAIAAGSGRFVAVGSDDSGPRVWQSLDGVAWSPMTISDTYVGGAGLSDVTYRGDGLFIAVGAHRFEAGGEALILRWDAEN